MRYKIIDVVGAQARRAGESPTSKVDAIKGLRVLGGLGLKEAKAIIDDLWDGVGGIAVVIDGVSVDHPDRRNAVSMLECSGHKVEVLDETAALRNALSDAAKLAMDIGKLAAARDIIGIVIDLER